MPDVTDIPVILEILNITTVPDTRGIPDIPNKLDIPD